MPSAHKGLWDLFYLSMRESPYRVNHWSERFCSGPGGKHSSSQREREGRARGGGGGRLKIGRRGSELHSWRAHGQWEGLPAPAGSTRVCSWPGCASDLSHFVPESGKSQEASQVGHRHLSTSPGLSRRQGVYGNTVSLCGPKRLAGQARNPPVPTAVDSRPRSCVCHSPTPPPCSPGAAAAFSCPWCPPQPRPESMSASPFPL